MSQKASPRYYAIISLSLSGSDEQVTANVTLAPADKILTADGAKPLHACTVADLQAYAAALQSDAWQTYREITLLELSTQDELELSLTVLDESGSAMPDSPEWMEQVVLLPRTVEAETAVEEIPVVENRAADEPAQPDEAATGDMDADQEEELDSPPPEHPGDKPSVSEDEIPAAPDAPVGEGEESSGPALETIPVEEAEPHIIVAAAEAIFTEREAGPEEVSTMRDGTQIAPSKARVRVAGRRRSADAFTQAAVDIFIEEPALRAAQAHALTSLNREVAGVLVGPRPEKQPDGSYVVQIVDTIIAKYTVMQGASVTYTPESWRYMNDKLHERYPDEEAVIVGWYHTHPGFGIFLSGMDLFIHQNFFTQIWHVAFVLDPRAKTSGFFSWNREKSEVKRVNFPWPHWAPGTW